MTTKQKESKEKPSIDDLQGMLQQITLEMQIIVAALERSKYSK